MRLCRLPAKESHGSASQESPTPLPDGGFISVWHFGLTQSKTRALNSPGSPNQTCRRRPARNVRGAPDWPCNTKPLLEALRLSLVTLITGPSEIHARDFCAVIAKFARGPTRRPPERRTRRPACHPEGNATGRRRAVVARHDGSRRRQR